MKLLPYAIPKIQSIEMPKESVKKMTPEDIRKKLRQYENGIAERINGILKDYTYL